MFFTWVPQRTRAYLNDQALFIDPWDFTWAFKLGNPPSRVITITILAVYIITGSRFIKIIPIVFQWIQSILEEWRKSKANKETNDASPPTT